MLINLILGIRKIDIVDNLEDKYLNIIIEDYYEFFKEYEHVSGLVEYPAYDSMSIFISNLWSNLGSTSNHINLLENLSKSSDVRVENMAKYTLESAYNQQQKDRVQPNSYYKEIFNKENINVDKEQNNSHKKYKWKDMSMSKKIGIVGSLASIIGLVLYFIPSDSQSTSANNNNQSIIIQGNNNGNITYNVDNSKTENNNITINKIDTLINEYTANIKSKTPQEQKEINTKLYMINKAKEIAKKRLPSSLQNEECKNNAKTAASLLSYELPIMYKVCDEIFK